MLQEVVSCQWGVNWLTSPPLLAFKKRFCCYNLWMTVFGLESVGLRSGLSMLARHCSISAAIAARSTWRRHCCLHPWQVRWCLLMCSDVAPAFDLMIEICVIAAPLWTYASDSKSKNFICLLWPDVQWNDKSGNAYKEAVRTAKTTWSIYYNNITIYNHFNTKKHTIHKGTWKICGVCKWL